MGEEKKTIRSRLKRLWPLALLGLLLVLFVVLMDANVRLRRASAPPQQGSEGPSKVRELLNRWEGRRVRQRLQEIDESRKAGDAKAAVRLVHLMRDTNELVRFGASRALAEIGAPAAVEPLIGAFRDGDARDRADVARTLGSLRGGRDAVEPLIGALKDGNADVRSGAAAALGVLKDPRAVEPLIGCLTDGDFDVRSSAAWALGELKDPRALEPLIAGLQDGDANVRMFAAKALGRLKHPRAVEALIGMLEVAAGRDEALAGLRQMTAPYIVDFGYDQKRWRKWWEENKLQFTENPIPEPP